MTPEPGDAARAVAPKAEETARAVTSTPEDAARAATATPEGATRAVTPRPEDAARAGPPLLEVSDLAVRFGPVRAVDGVSLRLAAGPFGLGLVGESGSGKSTIGRAVRPAGGSGRRADPF